MWNKNRGKYADKKKWLLSYHELMQDVEAEAERAGYWQERARSLHGVVIEPTGVRSSSRRTIHDCSDNFMDLARHCTELADMAERKKNEILAAIDKLENPEERQVLKMFYLRNKNFREIAEVMHYSIGWVSHAHLRALEKIQVPE